MNESTKTVSFVVTAVALVGAAAASHFATQPKSNSDFELVGTPFFEDFTSSDAAKSLEVSAFDPESLSLKQFSVKNDNGLWRIPSHHNYPAEAAARLAATATSVIGIERESLAGRNAKEHERLGVVDPREADTDDLEDPAGAGKRITLKDGSGEVLVDYIIGKEAGDVPTAIGDVSMDQTSPQKYYYVRRADEQQTYKVKLDIDLSTKFADWIDPDLLRLDPNQLVRLEIDNYTLVEDRDNLLGQVRALTKVQADKMDFFRGSSTEPWQLADLKPETEELTSLKVNAITNVLDEIKIAGVRPKFKYQDHLLLTPDLKLNARPEFKENPQEFGAAIQRLQDELEDRGFSLAGTSEELQLVSTNGELELGTNEGLLYKLQIGKEVEGEEKEIEIGLDKETAVKVDPTVKTEPVADASETDDAQQE